MDTKNSQKSMLGQAVPHSVLSRFHSFCFGLFILCAGASVSWSVRLASLKILFTSEEPGLFFCVASAFLEADAEFVRSFASTLGGDVGTTTFSDMLSFHTAVSSECVSELETPLGTRATALQRGPHRGVV